MIIDDLITSDITLLKNKEPISKVCAFAGLSNIQKYKKIAPPKFGIAINVLVKEKGLSMDAVSRLYERLLVQTLLRGKKRLT